MKSANSAELGKSAEEYRSAPAFWPGRVKKSLRWTYIHASGDWGLRGPSRRAGNPLRSKELPNLLATQPDTKCPGHPTTTMYHRCGGGVWFSQPAGFLWNPEFRYINREPRGFTVDVPVHLSSLPSLVCKHVRMVFACILRRKDQAPSHPQRGWDECRGSIPKGDTAPIGSLLTPSLSLTKGRG